MLSVVSMAELSNVLPGWCKMIDISHIMLYVLCDVFVLPVWELTGRPSQVYMAMCQTRTQFVVIS
jgi:hypothetical protein